MANFESGRGLDSIAASGIAWATVLVLNVLEHTFNPIAVLDSAVAIASANRGKVVVITPAVWSLHSFPIDCCRLLPDWYRQYAKSRHVLLEKDTFEYMGIGKVAEYHASQGEHFPPPFPRHPRRRWISRAIHKLFNTYGRGVTSPSHIAIGAVFDTKQRFVSALS